MSEKGFTITVPVHIKRDRRARKVVRQGPEPDKPPDPTPRIARLLALAHKWESMVRAGKIHDYAQIARLTRLTRGRVAQICSLTLLAPPLQAVILRSDSSPPSARDVRRIAKLVGWPEQLKASRILRST